MCSTTSGNRSLDLPILFPLDVEDTKSRPVLFAFNGGPGTSSMMLHVGLLGTKRIKYRDIDDDSLPLPPYESCDNEQCLLDVADLVLVDPVGTGFGRLLDESKKDLFYGIEPDAEAILTFIQAWLARYNRWQSPKYLVGESYGCTRASTVAGRFVRCLRSRLQRALRRYRHDRQHRYGREVLRGQEACLSRGSGVSHFGRVNWYHNHPSDQTVEEFVLKQAFADTEYL